MNEALALFSKSRTCRKAGAESYGSFKTAGLPECIIQAVFFWGGQRSRAILLKIQVQTWTSDDKADSVNVFSAINPNFH
ncbi:hypothetical protein TRIP_B260002 [uncultured Desulfatiglans sp.]|uniref:Uncharacterized protein n=1 Tax=Uncultured Desulfatiglans sp. TaxID=1748965 RepID=A0A653A634_UNCDX|nr:hypothetical protein TRIP_B260002 [uncultured Desulfatiglans sp.]